LACILVCADTEQARVARHWSFAQKVPNTVPQNGTVFKECFICEGQQSHFDRHCSIASAGACSQLVARRTLLLRPRTRHNSKLLPPTRFSTTCLSPRVGLRGRNGR